jgi:uncharacterized Zn-finger protein
MFFLYNIDLHNLKIQKMLHTMHPLYSTVEKVIDGLSILQVDAKHEDKETVSSPFTDAQANVLSAIQCHICKRSFKTKAGLTKHIKLKHAEEEEQSQEFSCSVCNKTCKNASGLTRHMSKHIVEDK